MKNNVNCVPTSKAYMSATDPQVLPGTQFRNGTKLFVKIKMLSLLEGSFMIK